MKNRLNRLARGALVFCLIVLPAMGQAPPTPAVTITGPAGTYSSTLVMATPGPVTLPSPWTGPAGTYTFVLPAGTVVTQTATGITITWGTPTPPPNPPPTPTPTTGPYTVLYLWDSQSASTLTPSQVALQTSSTILPALQSVAAGNQWIAGDVATMPTVKGWATFARSVGTPCVVICMVDNTGTHKVETITGTNFPSFDESIVKAEVTRLAAGGAPK